MKVYLFNTENGLYEGETYEEAGMLQYVDGITPVSPPDHEHGQVPVFDAEQNGWKIMPVSLVRDQINAKKG